MADAVYYPEREIPEQETVRVRDLTRDQLFGILEANTKTLNGMVQKYNALLNERNELLDENVDLRKFRDELSKENERLRNECLWYHRNRSTDAVVAILKAVADNNMQIHIEPRKLYDE